MFRYHPPVDISLVFNNPVICSTAVLLSTIDLIFDTDSKQLSFTSLFVNFTMLMVKFVEFRI